MEPHPSAFGVQSGEGCGARHLLRALPGTLHLADDEDLLAVRAVLVGPSRQGCPVRDTTASPHPRFLRCLTRVFAVGPVHHPTMARLQLRPGICEAERQHGVLDDRAGLIVGERIVVIVPPLEVRTERHPPADI